MGQLLLLVLVHAVNDEVDGKGLVVEVVDSVVQVLHLVGVDVEDQFEGTGSPRLDQPRILTRGELFPQLAKGLKTLSQSSSAHMIEPL